MEAIAGELLMVLASSTVSAAGQQAWQSLRALVLRRPAGEGEGEGRGTAGGEAVGQGELTALADEPDSAERARELVEALTERARRDPEFAQSLEEWRREAEAVRDVRTGVGGVRNEFSGTARGPVFMGRDFNGPINL